MSNDFITIQGARSHNLKDVSLKLKKNKITCFNGPSGSGKSSLAIDTLYLESKRRFINSLSTSQRFFWDLPQTCDVDRIDPVLPTWLLPQSNPLAASRTNVGDLLGVTTEVAKYFASVGKFYCKKHQADFVEEDMLFVLRGFLEEYKGKGPIHILVHRDSAPVDEMMFSRSYDSKAHEVREFSVDDDFVELFRTKKLEEKRIYSQLKLLKATEFWIFAPDLAELYLLRPKLGRVCPQGDRIPLLDSFNYFNPLLSFGACQECKGMGDKLEYDRRKVIPNKSKSFSEGACNLLLFKRFKKYESLFLEFCKEQSISISKPFKEIESEELWKVIEIGNKSFIGLNRLYDLLEKKRYKKPYRIFARKFKSEFECPICNGTRLNHQLFNAYVTLNNKNIFYDDLISMNLRELCDLFEEHRDESVMTRLLYRRFSIAVKLGLSHLTLKHVGKKLLTSEYQRLLLVKYLSYEGSGSLFILDEPSVGLSFDEQQILFNYLKELREKNNTVVLIEHSVFLQKLCDEIVTLGPEAGARGGEILYQGKWKKQSYDCRDLLPVAKSKSVKSLKVKEASCQKSYLKEFELPLNSIVYVSGNSSSGKSIFFNHIVANELNLKTKDELLTYERYSVKRFECPVAFSNIVVFAFESKSYTSRSTIGTLLGVTPLVRKYYASLRESKAMNLRDGHFSPNTDNGKCLSCEGRGIQVVEMDILEDVSFTCPDCQGKKLRPIYADISDGSQTFYESISMSMDNVLDRISLTPKFIRIYEYIKKLRLEYLSLDRSFNSLSGGEKQRVLLLIEVLRNKSDVFYLFEHLSAGLSETDLSYVARFLQEIVLEKNSVVILDENPFWKKVAEFDIEFDSQS